MCGIHAKAGSLFFFPAPKGLMCYIKQKSFICCLHVSPNFVSIVQSCRYIFQYVTLVSYICHTVLFVCTQKLGYCDHLCRKLDIWNDWDFITCHNNDKLTVLSMYTYLLMRLAVSRHLCACLSFTCAFFVIKTCDVCCFSIRPGFKGTCSGQEETSFFLMIIAEVKTSLLHF